MDKLFWSIWKKRVKENAVSVRNTTVEMDDEETQNHFSESRGEKAVRAKTRASADVLSLADRLLLDYQRITRAV